MNIFLRAAAVVLATACAKDVPPVRMIDVQRASVTEMQPNILSDDAPRRVWRITARQFRRPFALQVLGDSLAVVLDRAYPFMHLIDIKRGEYLRPLTVSPDENTSWINVFRLAPSPRSQTEFVAYDAIGSTLSTFRIESAGVPLTLLGTVALNAIEQIDAPVVHADGSISVEPVRENSLRARVLPDGQLAAHSGISLASLKTEWVPAGAWREAMEGQTCPSPDRSRLARTFQHMGQMMVLDSAGDGIDGLQYDRHFAPQFNVRGPTGEVSFAASGVDVRLAYRSCGVTQQRIFALFSGRRVRLSERNSEMQASQIHVFNWDGRMTGGFRLANDAVQIGVNPEGTLLLALEADARQAVVVAYTVPRRYQ